MAEGPGHPNQHRYYLHSDAWRDELGHSSSEDFFFLSFFLLLSFFLQFFLSVFLPFFSQLFLHSSLPDRSQQYILPSLIILDNRWFRRFPSIEPSSYPSNCAPYDLPTDTRFLTVVYLLEKGRDSDTIGYCTVNPVSIECAPGCEMIIHEHCRRISGSATASWWWLMTTYPYVVQFSSDEAV